MVYRDNGFKRPFLHDPLYLKDTETDQKIKLTPHICISDDTGYIRLALDGSD